MHLGQPVLYYDEDLQPNAGWVAFVHEKTLPKADDRPICNLATLDHRGRFIAKRLVEPAYFDGTRWHLLNKWALPDEVPDTEWNHLTSHQQLDKQHGFLRHQVKTTFPSDK